MAGPTTIAFGSPMAVKRWSPRLFLDIAKKSYFSRKFTSKGENTPIQLLTDLEQEAGDTISFDLHIQLRGSPVTGDNRLEGKEQTLRFHTDTLKIDQMRQAVSAGGKMTRKRTAHNMRTIAKNSLSDYWSTYTDEMMFIYLSGARGINQDFHEPLTWAGHAANAIQAPDSGHILYGGDATSKGSIDASDKMSKIVIEKASVKAKSMRTTDPTNMTMMPITINNERHYVMIMSQFQEFDLRTGDTSGWVEAQKAAAAAEGRNNPIFKGGLGMIDNVVLHSHESVIRFSDYGTGSPGTLPAARALLLGAQAGVMAYGSSNKQSRFDWKEEMRDYDNEPTVASGCILGVKKSRFNGKDFGVLAIDTHAKDPNA